MIFDSRIAGIPCQIEITHYTPAERKIVTCTTIDPPDPGELEWQVLDRKGYPAAWLEAKMTRDDVWRIDDECEQCIADAQESAAIDAAELKADMRRENWA